MEGLQAGSGGLEHLRLETGQEAQMPRWSREHYGGDAEETADPRDEQGVGQRPWPSWTGRLMCTPASDFLRLG